MVPPLFLLHFIDGAVGSALLLSLAIIVGTFILEDPTTVIVGVLAADGVISVPLALLSLYTGVILGDIGFYWLGWLASTHPRLGRYVDHDLIAPIRTWLESRYVLTVFSARFIPGSRLPTYAASGFLRSPFSTFVLTAVVATSIWTTILFSISYGYGSVTGQWFVGQRWSLAVIFVLILFFIAHHNLKFLRSTRQTDGDTHTTSAA